MDSLTLVTQSLIYGGILAALLSAVVLWSVSRNAEMWIGDYPPDIKEKWGPMSDAAKRQRISYGILFLLCPLTVTVIFLWQLQAAAQQPLAFWEVYWGIVILFSVFNLVDLIILDWLIFVRIQPSFIVLPGTEGMAGYGDYFFHFKAFMIGVAGTLVAALLIAGVYKLFF